MTEPAGKYLCPLTFSRFAYKFYQPLIVSSTILCMLILISELILLYSENSVSAFTYRKGSCRKMD